MAARLYAQFNDVTASHVYKSSTCLLIRFPVNRTFGVASFKSEKRLERFKL